MPKLLVDAGMARYAAGVLRFQGARFVQTMDGQAARALTPVSEGGEAVPFERLSECSPAVIAAMRAYCRPAGAPEERVLDILRAAEDAAGYSGSPSGEG